MKKLLLLTTIFFCLLSHAQEKTKYIINTRTGKFDAINSLTGSGIIMQNIPIDTNVVWVLTLDGDTLKKAQTTTSNSSATGTLKEHYISDVNMTSLSPDTLSRDTLTAGTYLLQLTTDVRINGNASNAIIVTLERYLNNGVIDIRDMSTPVTAAGGDYIPPPFRNYVVTLTSTTILKFVVTISALPLGGGTLHIYYTSILIQKL